LKLFENIAGVWFFELQCINGCRRHWAQGSVCLPPLSEMSKYGQHTKYHQNAPKLAISRSKIKIMRKGHYLSPDSFPSGGELFFSTHMLLK